MWTRCGFAVVYVLGFVWIMHGKLQGTVMVLYGIGLYFLWIQYGHIMDNVWSRYG